jgi:hypothetical protein
VFRIRNALNSLKLTTSAKVFVSLSIAFSAPPLAFAAFIDIRALDFMWLPILMMILALVSASPLLPSLRTLTLVKGLVFAGMIFLSLSGLALIFSQQPDKVGAGLSFVPNAILMFVVAGLAKIVTSIQQMFKGRTRRMATERNRVEAGSPSRSLGGTTD